MRIGFLISATALAVLAPHAALANWCYSNAVYRDFDDLQAYIWKVATYYGVEHRKTEQELATASESADAIHKKYGATGTIRCAGFKGSASVTVKHNVITTSATRRHLSKYYGIERATGSGTGDRSSGFGRLRPALE